MMKKKALNGKGYKASCLTSGFVFSMDAALALITVLIVVASAASFVSETEKNTEISETLGQKASDRAAVANLTIDLTKNQSKETIGASTEFGECRVVYVTNLNNILWGGMITPTKNSFCEKA